MVRPRVDRIKTEATEGTPPAIRKSRGLNSVLLRPKVLEAFWDRTLSKEEWAKCMPQGIAMAMRMAVSSAARSLMPMATMRGIQITPEMLWPKMPEMDTVTSKAATNSQAYGVSLTKCMPTKASESSMPRPVSRTKKAITLVPPTKAKMSQSRLLNSSFDMKPLPKTITTTPRDRHAEWPMIGSSFVAYTVMPKTAANPTPRKSQCQSVSWTWSVGSILICFSHASW
mmetsp:Transcript_85792/g.167861  ORF Transcript_85792/g.167861 Transcript_85792/m.167861 type:complete len:227 (-) Transcript_85792:108-788(-)